MPDLPPSHRPPSWKGKRHEVPSTGTPRLRGRRRQERNKRLAQRDPLCVDCLAETPPRYTPVVEWHHVIPLSQGGADHESNLVGLCEEHHQLRHKGKREIGVDGWPK